VDITLQQKGFKRYPTSPAQKSHALHISLVRTPGTVPISRHRCLRHSHPSPPGSSQPFCARPAAGGCCAARSSGCLQPSAGVSGAGGCKAQGRAHQLINRPSTGFCGFWIRPLTPFFQFFLFLSSHSPSAASTFSIDLIHCHFFYKIIKYIYIYFYIDYENCTVLYAKKKCIKGHHE